MKYFKVALILFVAASLLACSNPLADMLAEAERLQRELEEQEKQEQEDPGKKKKNTKTNNYWCRPGYGEYSIEWVEDNGVFQPALVSIGFSSGANMTNVVKSKSGEDYNIKSYYLEKEEGIKDVGVIAGKWALTGAFIKTKSGKEVPLSLDDYLEDLNQGLNLTKVYDRSYSFEDKGSGQGAMTYTDFIEVLATAEKLECTVTTTFTYQKISDHKYDLVIKKSSGSKVYF